MHKIITSQMLSKGYSMIRSTDIPDEIKDHVEQSLIWHYLKQ
jgi:hypothetical protein